MNYIGKEVYLRDWDGKKTNDWGIIEDYDGEYFWISFVGDKNDIKPYCRNEFIITRK